MPSPSFKKQYTFILSLAFIAIGSYRLYDHFYKKNEAPMYQLALSGFLIALGIYQLIQPYLAGKNSK